MGDYPADVPGAIPSGNADLTNHPDALILSWMPISRRWSMLARANGSAGCRNKRYDSKGDESVLNNELTLLKQKRQKAE